MKLNWNWNYLIIFVIYFKSFVCGQRLYDSRIIGGYPAQLNAVKHQVSIRLKRYDKREFGNGFSCGGSLISEISVLTAAHCMHTSERNYRPDEFKIVLGTLYLNKKTVSTMTRFVSQIIIHPKYEDLEHDVAIMRLSKPVPLNETTRFIVPINLTNKSFPSGTQCQVSGWGSTIFNGPPNNELLSANVTIIDTNQCNSTKSYRGLILHGMMCAGNLSAGGVDACQGDSGGPLVCNDTLAGIISWGLECGLRGHPGVYADVAYYRDWILKNNSNANSTIMSFMFVIMLLVLV